MPIVNAAGGFNTGRDATIVILMPRLLGGVQRVDLPNLTNFDCKQESTMLKVKPQATGLTLHANLPDGWTGSFDNERYGPALDDAFADQENAWLDGGVVLNGTMFTYLREPDGSTSTYQFSNVAYKLDNAGSYSSDKTVAQKVSFMATRRQRV